MPSPADPMIIARGAGPVGLLPKMANRHGLVAGATGTGKTVTLRVISERLSRIGVPVFMADIKGDLSGMARPGGENQKVAERVREFNITDFRYEAYPVVFWDVFGEQGHPVRATVSDMGPLLMGRILGLTDIQADVLALIFKVADENGLLLLDIKDLRAMSQYAADNAAELRIKYGNITPATVGAIQRSLLTLEEQGGERFFGEPMLDINEFLSVDGDRGTVNILAADRLFQSPRLYATFLLWLLSELYERLPEVGDLEKPKLVFFFDEAHLLFSDTPKVLTEKIIQVVRLIRSKGVGVWFVTQNPLDLPEEVLGQLGNRVQHALRAFTPRDQKAVRAAAGTMRPNPVFETVRVVTERGNGEALVSLLDQKGTPGITERAFVCPPASQLLPLSPDQRRAGIQGSPVFNRYENAVDRQSAYEALASRASAAPGKAPAAQPAPRPSQPSPRKEPSRTSARSAGQDILDPMAKTASREFGTAINRGILGGMRK